MTFTNLIRFKDEQGMVHYGDVREDQLDALVNAEVDILEGDPLKGDLIRSGRVAIVREVLCPVEEVPLVLCIGLNYAKHAMEANLPIPPSPVLFIKPPASIGGPFDDIPIPSHADLLDNEGELCLVIGKTGKNIPENEADDYILGYTAGNDISSRFWQRPPHAGGQYCYAKGFDKFAPIGPTIRATHLTNTSTLSLTTTVNGEERQSSLTGDMIFNTRQIVAHLSRGCTLAAGTVIMTGTPDGIAGRMSTPAWLKNNDVVRVSVSGIGTIENRMVFGKL